MRVPVNFHSVIDSPERVSRVMPPSTIRVKTHPEQPPSQSAICCRCTEFKPCTKAGKPLCTGCPGMTCTWFKAVTKHGNLFCTGCPGMRCMLFKAFTKQSNLLCTGYLGVRCARSHFCRLLVPVPKGFKLHRSLKQIQLLKW